MQQCQGEEELHRHAGLPAEHHQRLLADGVPGELPGHRDDHQGGGEREGGFAAPPEMTQVCGFAVDYCVSLTLARVPLHFFSQKNISRDLF